MGSLFWIFLMFGFNHWVVFFKLPNDFSVFQNDKNDKNDIWRYSPFCFLPDYDISLWLSEYYECFTTCFFAKSESVIYVGFDGLTDNGCIINLINEYSCYIMIFYYISAWVYRNRPRPSILFRNSSTIFPAIHKFRSRTWLGWDAQ